MSAAIVAIVTVGVGILTTLIGLEYRNLKRRIADLESTDEQDADERQSISQKVDTLWRWAFGREDDGTDGGLAAEIQDGFDRIEEDLEHLEKKQETYHESEMTQFERLVNALHDDEDIDVTREDVLSDYDKDK